jgi:hypothetical protein
VAEPELHSAQQIGFGDQPYGVYRPEPPMPQPLSYPQPFTPESTRKDDEGWEDITHQIVPGDEWPSRVSPGKISSPGGPFNPAMPSDMYNSEPRPAAAFSVIPEGSGVQAMTDGEQQTQQGQVPYLRDTSAAGASAYAPPAGNTTGLRPVQRRTWDDLNKEWKTYWVWGL